MNRNQTRHASATLIFRPHRVARPLRRNHEYVEVSARLDQVEMHIEPMREHERRAVLHVLDKVIAVDVALQFVRREHHHHVGPFGRFRDFHDLELFAFGLFHAGRGLAQRNRNFFHAAVTQIERVSVALAAVSDNGDLLAFDEVQVSVAIVVNTHGN